jgi:hypothetical protein
MSTRTHKGFHGHAQAAQADLSTHNLWMESDALHVFHVYLV